MYVFTLITLIYIYIHTYIHTMKRQPIWDKKVILISPGLDIQPFFRDDFSNPNHHPVCGQMCSIY